MPRRRDIHPKIWLDEDFVRLSMKARLLLLAMGAMSDYADRLRYDRSAIEEFAALPDIGPEIAELEAAGMIQVTAGVIEVVYAYGASKRRRHKWQDLRSRVFIRDNFTCRYCGATEGPFHCDHVFPVSRGGTNDLSNLVCACADCNLSKGDRLLADWRPDLARVSI